MADNDFLQKILTHKRAVNASKVAMYDSYKKKIGADKYTRYSLFKRQISKEGSINLIAEIKKASPSKGLIRKEFDILRIGEAYFKNGAAALSVLTEDKYFLGSLAYLKKVSDAIDLPTLTKDFIIGDGQIYEARVNGASAILLIVAILSDDQLKQFIETAHSLDLDCLVEVHDKEELDRAMNCGAEIIGINNRNLMTFETSLSVSAALIPLIPKDKVIVAESGIQTKEDVESLKQLGAHAVLIGEAFMRADDIGNKVKELMNG